MFSSKWVVLREAFLPPSPVCDLGSTGEVKPTATDAGWVDGNGSKYLLKKYDVVYKNSHNAVRIIKTTGQLAICGIFHVSFYPYTMIACLTGLVSRGLSYSSHKDTCDAAGFTRSYL